MNLPASIRAFQQGYTYHVLKSAVYAAATAGVTAYFSANREAAGAVAVTTFLGTLQSGLEHSPNSASFNTNGEPIKAVAQIKEMADNVVAIQVKASDPAIPQVTQADANKAAVTLNDATLAVAMNNQIVKEALANETRPGEKP